MQALRLQSRAPLAVLLAAWAPLVVLVVLAVIAAPTASSEELDSEADLFLFYDEFSHNCLRNCAADPKPRVCSYRFRLEWYMTMSKACYSCPANLTDCSRPHCVSADGFKRALISVNRQLAGPGIHVCEGDNVTVLVDNHMEMGEGAAIHWHGIHQAGTPHMDGVAQVTQCAIGAHSSFVYSFIASPAGTHFWHSHLGMQRAEGVYGPLVVRRAADPHASLYDFDLPQHTLVLSDWFHELTANKFANHHYSNGSNKPKGILINGRGAYDPIVNGTYTPRYVLKVQPGSRYRIRVVSNAALNCPFAVSVANHSLLAIATDGSPFQPVEVDSLVVLAGERFDFVLTANQSVDNYLLQVVGLADCDTRFTSAHQSAIVSYVGANEADLQGLGNPSYGSMLADGGDRQLNPFNREPGPGDYAVDSLQSLEPDRDRVLATATTGGSPDAKFYLAFDFEIVNNSKYHHPAYYPISAVPKSNGHLYTPQINNVAMHMPTAPLVHQMDEVAQEAICNNTEFARHYETSFKSCHHALRIGLNQLVEIILIDKGVTFDASHPFHLHGNSFRVIGMEKLGSSTTVEQVKSLDAAGRLRRNSSSLPVLKDTVAVPDGGYTILRFRASNPGPWFLHCHLEFHVESGMGLLLLVGDPADWAARVPANFPRCGSWLGPGPEVRVLQQQQLMAEAEAAHRRQMLGLGLGLGLGALVVIVAAVVVTALVTKSAAAAVTSGSRIAKHTLGADLSSPMAEPNPTGLSVESMAETSLGEERNYM